MDVIVYSSNYCPLGSYEHHSIEDHFEKWQGYETRIILKSEITKIHLQLDIIK